METLAVSIPSGKDAIFGDLNIPPGAAAIVLFAHGSASSRFSPRNKFVAGQLNKKGLATLLFDLLTKKEEEQDLLTGKYRFDIDLLTRRLADATRWAGKNNLTSKMKTGYFGASTGAAAALKAAAQMPEIISAIVSRGGRPDLAAESLILVKSPTLLIVGGNDPVVLKLNQEAAEKLNSEKRIAVVPSATHLFEEPGALEKVAQLAEGWFRRYLR